jgi:Fe-S-cluster containining protein
VELHATRDSPRGVNLWDGCYEVVLRKRAGDDCIFLLSLDAARRCAIQPYKPRSCAVYPFTLDDKGELWHRADMLCPRPWSVDSAGQDETRAEIRRMRAEWRAYEGLVADWNASRAPGAGVTEFKRYVKSTVAPGAKEDYGKDG